MHKEIIDWASKGFLIVCYSRLMTVEEFIQEVPEEDILDYEFTDTAVLVATVSELIAATVTLSE